MFLQRERLGGAEPVRLHRIEGKTGDVERDHLEPRERRVFQRIGGIARLAQVTFAESTRIGDDQAARAQFGAGLL